MLVKDWYNLAIEHKADSLLLLLDFLILEKGVLSFEDDESRLQHFMQEKYRAYTDKHLLEYKQKLEAAKNGG